MALDPLGEHGLRRRLEIAVQDPNSYASVAFATSVPEETLRAYLADPDYVLSPVDLGAILAVLPDLPGRDYAKRGNQGYAYIVYEKPQWTQEDIDALEPPPGATQAAVYVVEETYADEVATDGPESLDTFSVQQLIDAATGSDPDNLLQVIWYVPYVEYPYYSSD